MCRQLFARLLATGGPEQKTIIFCARDSHADRVAAAMNNLYADWCAAVGQTSCLPVPGAFSPRDSGGGTPPPPAGWKPALPYAFKCTASVGSAQHLADLRGATRSHFVATTVDLLTTGVDVPCVQNIVFFKYVRSPIAFYQMLGRGTRLHPPTGKLMFRVYDFTNATRLLGENPPFGGKEGKEAQTRFAYKTGATQVLFLQHGMDSLKPGGRCGIVLDEGVLFRTNEQAFVQTKRKLLDDCDLWCIVSLPPGTFVNAGAGVKANLLFFTKARPTERIWYYDLSDIKVGKKTPLTAAHFEEFLRLVLDESGRPGGSDRSWVASRAEIEARGYDLKAVNPHRNNAEDTRTPKDLLAFIEVKGREVMEALRALKD